MRHLGYVPCTADCDIWMKTDTNPNDLCGKPGEKTIGDQYYPYILYYVDDALVIHHDALSVLEKIDKYF